MRGPKAEEGAMPALIYFALNGHDSLNLDPYNQPVQALQGHPIRSFSWDLPFHAEEVDPTHSLKLWNEAFADGEDFVTPFLDHSIKKIEELIEDGLIEKNKICISGLSRGGFMALHLAKKIPYIKHVLAYAPLTNLHSFQGEAVFPDSVFKTWNLVESAEELIHKKIRFYIGNLDERVGTSHAYELIHTLAKKAHANRMRHFDYELYITPSIGFKGHGTRKEIFFEGAHWAAAQLEVQ